LGRFSVGWCRDRYFLRPFLVHCHCVPDPLLLHVARVSYMHNKPFNPIARENARAGLTAALERKKRMDDIATRSAEIELYSDLVKIGVPALTGLLGGLIGGLIPYFLEKRKLREAERREAREYWRKQVGELIDCLSDFS